MGSQLEVMDHIFLGVSGVVPDQSKSPAFTFPLWDPARS